MFTAHATTSSTGDRWPGFANSDCWKGSWNSGIPQVIQARIWWFGTWILFSPIAGMMIQSDFHIWKEGLKPPTSMSWYVWPRLDESLLSFSATQLIFCYNKEYWYTNQLYTIYVQTIWGKRSNTSELIMTDNILMVYPLYNHYIKKI